MSFPFKLTSRAREANASPSVYLEKGRYRIRNPAPKPEFRNVSQSSRIRSLSTSNDRNSIFTAIIVILLAFACLTCFGAAYYLFTTRWDSASLASGSQPANTSILQVLELDDARSKCPLVNPDTKFLAYLPHSGFHNQRIALENALTLSHMLNRTLLVPPARLGRKSLRYVNYDSLKTYVSLSGKEGLDHCSRLPSHINIPPECSDYFDYTHVSWEWLADLKVIKSQQKLIFRWNMTDGWVHDCLSINDSNTLTLRDTGRYHYRFLDTSTDASPVSHKYQEDLHVSSLIHLHQPLLQIGTLFGTSRLRLQNSENIDVRRKVRESMSFANPVLLQVADAVHKALGGFYLGVHVRIGDGQFLIHSNDNVRLVWWRMMHEVLGFTIEDTLRLEKSFSTRESPPTPPDTFMRQPIQPGEDFPLTTQSPKTPCRAVLHSLPHLVSLNIPLFISTDVKDPGQDPNLEIFLRTFPCTFFLADFTKEMSLLDHFRNDYDGLALKPFVSPFVDAMIAGKAWRVIGTPGSTFSRFVEDLLWPTYHGVAIQQRG
ncbi:hypothetical protein D9758_008502 [Tetrapyrgos nigripes]|uniref:Uncharacterized protein n=1 Tax=Tetrapyrgos nigripes TaxID=182062 RepID=A0A8H5CP64_9AGAR|nr:hypothetical protein D9758_008502 [Tetrapyrgos nigripes]